MNWFRRWMIGEEYIEFQSAEREAVRDVLASHAKQIYKFQGSLDDQLNMLMDVSRELNDLRNQLSAQSAVAPAPPPHRRRLPWSEFKPLLESQVRSKT